jgi:hypothetical protein
MIAIEWLAAALTLAGAAFAWHDSRRSARELAKAREHKAETRRLMTMLSEAHAQTAELVLSVRAMDEVTRGIAHKVDAALEYHLADARRLASAAAAEDHGHERLAVVLNGEIAWLRRAMEAQRSHGRAHEDLEAERLVREAGSRDDAIAQGPLPFVPPGPSSGPRFSTQRRSASDADEAPEFAHDAPVLATSGGPVAGE